MHLCEAMGLDQQQFVDLLDGGPLGSRLRPGRSLARCCAHDYPAGFPVRLALKDLQLVREVASGAGVELPVLDAVLERMTDDGNSHADDDLAAVYELTLPSRAER